MACGLPRDKALAYAAQMLAGSARMVLETGAHPVSYTHLTEEERAEKEEKLAELAQDTFFPRLEKVIGLTQAARGAALTWRMGTPG